MSKLIDTDHADTKSRSMGTEYYRELCRRELLSSGQQLRSVLAALNKNKTNTLAAGVSRYV